MHPTVKAARIAGAIYLSLVVIAPFALIYVPSKLIVRGDADRDRWQHPGAPDAVPVGHRG